MKCIEECIAASAPAEKDSLSLFLALGPILAPL